tara:strand:+ start:20 stop:1096 length:1077 start_codon:yes stop_codon:yes gene_type:complete
MIDIKNIKIPDYTTVLISILILVFLVKCKIKNPFWDKQPVMRPYMKGHTGVISKSPVFNIKLKPNQKIILNNYSISEIKDFLQDNFSNYYNVNTKYLDYSLRKKQAHNIVLLENKKIIGFIHSSPILVYLNQKLVKFRYVDYLCIHEKYRDNYMATILIASIIKVNHRKQPIMFKKDFSRLPYDYFISTNYHIKDLRKLNPKINHKIEKLTPFNFYKYYDYTNTLLKRYTVKSLYSRKDFFDLFLGKNVMDYYIISNPNGYKTVIIGKKTIYKLDDNILNCFEIDIVIGELRYLKDVDEQLCNYLKSNGYNYICISAIGSNIKYIKDNEYKRNSRVYYYTYNYSMPNILPNECVININ